MKLTKDQIQELYKFTRAHYVEHYDLQTELVDHLANGIERHWAQFPNLSFEEAKQKEFKKFGVFGFMDVIAERHKAMRKRYRKIIWRFLLQWWSFSKLIGILLGILISFFTINSLPKGDFRFGTITVVFYVLAVLMLYRSFQLKKEIENTSKKWVLQEIIYRQGLTVQIFIIPIHLFNMTIIRGMSNTIFGELAIAVFLVCLVILLKVCGYSIPSKTEEILLETYPEYKN